MSEAFKGIPLEDLRIESVLWPDDYAEHMEKRAERKGTAEFQPTVEQATEAVGDPNRLIGVASEESIKVIGYSPSAKRLLKVWLMAWMLETGDWVGVSGCEARRNEKQRYGSGD